MANIVSQFSSRHNNDYQNITGAQMPRAAARPENAKKPHPNRMRHLSQKRRSFFRRIRNPEPDVHHRRAERLAQPQRLCGREEGLRPRLLGVGRLEADRKDVSRRRLDEVAERDVRHPLRRAVVESVVAIDALALAHTLARPSGRLRRSFPPKQSFFGASFRS